MRKMHKALVLALIMGMTLQSVGFANSIDKTAEVENPKGLEAATNVYKWDKIADMAIAKNVDFKTTEIDKMKLGRQMEDLSNTVNTLQSMGYLTVTDKKDKTDPLIDNITLLKNNRQSIDENIALKKEILKDTVKNLYITIYKYEKQLDSLNEQVKLNESLLVVDRKKLQLGLISKYDLEKNFNGYQKIERTKSSLSTNIDKLYTSIKDIAGIEQSKVIFLDFSFIDFDSVIPVTHDANLEKMSNENLKIQMYQKSADRAKSFRSGVKDRYAIGDSNFDLADLDYDKAQATLDNAVSSLAYRYESAYVAATDAYDNYIQKQSEYNVKILEMKNTNLKLKLGSSSTLETLITKTQMKVIQNELLNAKADYLSAKVALESTIKGTN